MGDKYSCIIEDGPDRNELLKAFNQARERKIVASTNLGFIITQESGERKYCSIGIKYIRIKCLEHDDSNREYEEYGYEDDEGYDKDSFMLKGRMFVCFNLNPNPEDDKYTKSTFWASYNTKTHKGRITIETYE